MKVDLSKDIILKYVVQGHASFTLSNIISILIVMNFDHFVRSFNLTTSCLLFQNCLPILLKYRDSSHKNFHLNLRRQEVYQGDGD